MHFETLALFNSLDSLFDKPVRSTYGSYLENTGLLRTEFYDRFESPKICEIKFLPFIAPRNSDADRADDVVWN